MAIRKAIVSILGVIQELAAADTLAGFVDQKLNANATTSAIAATNTNLSFAMAANEIWEVEFQGTAQCSSTGGTKYAISAPTGATVEGWIVSSTSAILTKSEQRLTAINTLSATALHTVATTPGSDVVKFTITNGSTAGNCVLQIASVISGQMTTLFAGSYWKARRSLSV